MSYVIAIINQKGGVGKSTTAHALATGLTLRGFRVLAIDMEPQGNLSYSFGAEPEGLSVFDLLNGHPAGDTIQRTMQGEIIASATSLNGADISFIETGKEYRLREALLPIKSNFDYIVIDTPPALGILAINALTAADGAIVPALADIFSVQGIGQLYSTITAVRRYTNPQLVVLGILLTRYSSRSILARDIAEMLEDTAKELQSNVFNARIREAVAVREAQASQQSLFAYAAKSTAAQDYQELIDELLALDQKKY